MLLREVSHRSARSPEWKGDDQKANERRRTGKHIQAHRGIITPHALNRYTYTHPVLLIPQPTTPSEQSPDSLNKLSTQTLTLQNPKPTLNTSPSNHRPNPTTPHPLTPLAFSNSKTHQSACFALATCPLNSKARAYIPQASESSQPQPKRVRVCKSM